MDHVMGLASLIASSATRPNNMEQPLEVYGPMGLHKFICEILCSTECSAHMNVIVHELVYTEQDEKELWNAPGSPALNMKQARRSLWKNRKYFDQQPMCNAQKKYRSIQRKSIFCSDHVLDGKVVGRYWELVKTPKVWTSLV